MCIRDRYAGNTYFIDTNRMRRGQIVPLAAGALRPWEHHLSLYAVRSALNYSQNLSGTND